MRSFGLPLHPSELETKVFSTIGQEESMGIMIRSILEIDPSHVIQISREVLGRADLLLCRVYTLRSASAGPSMLTLLHRHEIAHHQARIRYLFVIHD